MIPFIGSRPLPALDVYTDNDRAKQLLYSLDENVLGVKVTPLQETIDFNTLNCE